VRTKTEALAKLQRRPRRAEDRLRIWSSDIVSRLIACVGELYCPGGYLLDFHRHHSKLVQGLVRPVEWSSFYRLASGTRISFSKEEYLALWIWVGPRWQAVLRRAVLGPERAAMKRWNELWASGQTSSSWRPRPKGISHGGQTCFIDTIKLNTAIVLDSELAKAWRKSAELHIAMKAERRRGGEVGSESR